MNFITVVLSLFCAASASNSIQAAAIFKIEATDALSHEMGKLIAPYLFQNSLDQVIKEGASRLINCNWRIKAKTSSYMTSKDHSSQLFLAQVFHVYPEETYGLPESKPVYTITHNADYDNVLDSFEQRSSCPNHVYTLNNGSIIVKPNEATAAFLSNIRIAFTKSCS